MKRSDPGDGNPEMARPSIDETVDQANKAIEEARAEIARAQALRRSTVDLARELDRISQAQTSSPAARERKRD